MAETAIEWATHVWNPVTGCSRVSPGCAHCYALTYAGRLKAMGQAKYQRDGGRGSGPGFGIKQWGGNSPKAGGRELDGRTWDELPATATR